MRRALATLVAAASLLAGAESVRAEPAVVVGPGNVLRFFDTATPGTIDRTVTIFGLGVNQTVRGIDQRPQTLELYASAVTTGSANNSTVFTYRIDPITGAATLIGDSGALAGAGDVPTGYDFNPTVDRIRFVNTNDENARLNPNNGTLAGNDTDLTPAATTTIIGEAYDRNIRDTALTTLYAIDRNDSQVGIQGGINGTPSPNGGVVTDLAPLGVTLNAANDGGFDISRETATGFAALTDAADNFTRLYRITLPTSATATPAATPVGLIGNGQTEVRGLTILSPQPTGSEGAPTPQPGPVTETTAPAPPPPAPVPVPRDITRPAGAFLVSGTGRVAAFLRSGLRARFGCSEACRADAVLTLGRTRIGQGSGSLAQAGVGRVVVRALAAARRRLRRGRRSRLLLTITLRDVAGNATRIPPQRVLVR